MMQPPWFAGPSIHEVGHLFNRAICASNILYKNLSSNHFVSLALNVKYDFLSRSFDFLVGWYQKIEVGIVTGWAAGVRFPTGHGFSLLRSVQSGSRTHAASCPVGTGGDFPGGKAARA
jgi:hypothetical protein